MKRLPRIIVIRVGADTGQKGGGFLSPLFDDNSFDLICIPEFEFCGLINEKRTYSNCVGNSSGKYWIKHIPENIQDKMADQIVHFDPEFETFTYGDPGKNRRKLGELEKNDILIFYAGLESKNKLRACYVVGYFEITQSLCLRNTTEKERNELLNEFSNNFHIKHKNIFNHDTNYPNYNGLKLVRGSDNSRLLKKAYRISNYLDKGHYYLSDNMKQIFGPLGSKSDLLRSTPREVQREYITTVIDWLKTLT